MFKWSSLGNKIDNPPPINLFFNVSQRVQRTRVQIFYLLTGWVEKPVRDVNVYRNHKNAGFQISSHWVAERTDGAAIVLPGHQLTTVHGTESPAGLHGNP